MPREDVALGGRIVGEESEDSELGSWEQDEIMDCESDASVADSVVEDDFVLVPRF
jgi:hypothetical protein